MNNTFNPDAFLTWKNIKAQKPDKVVFVKTDDFVSCYCEDVEEIADFSSIAPYEVYDGKLGHIEYMIKQENAQTRAEKINSLTEVLNQSVSRAEYLDKLAENLDDKLVFENLTEKEEKNIRKSIKQAKEEIIKVAKDGLEAVEKLKSETGFVSSYSIYNTLKFLKETAERTIKWNN